MNSDIEMINEEGISEMDMIKVGVQIILYHQRELTGILFISKHF